jgi:predicted TPR repeat methyltransferase
MTNSSPILLQRLGEMVDGGRHAGARALLAAVRAQGGDTADTSELEARILLREGRGPEAVDLLNDAIRAFPENAALHARRAEARSQANDPWGAAADAAEAVILDSASASAKALLGITLLEIGRSADAVSCLMDALHTSPSHTGYLRALATAQEREGDADAAAATLAHAASVQPGDPALRTAAIMVQMRRRAFRAAADLAEAARREGVVDACILGLLGHALSSLGEHDRAAEMYRDALKLGPDDPYVRHLVAASGALPHAKQACEAYLETVFDGYAARFEAHLIGLGYRGPGLLRAALLRHLPGAEADGIPALLDLGCGTGLVGVVLSDIIIPKFVGVDISQRMLDEAGAKGMYSELVHTGIEAFLAARREAWPVVIAADVFCYFGALESVLPAVFERMAPGGLFLFTAELLADPQPGEAWRLTKLGRYGHTADYLRQAAVVAGFEILEIREDILRFEGETPVDANFVTLRRRHHA